jgi:hypothetical protein
MKNIHVLPTPLPSRLVKNNDKNTYALLSGFIKSNPAYTTQHIYITNDEKPKEDEYYLGEDDNIYCLVTTVNYNGKKIILTTDPDLIKDGVQAIDDEFLQWFVKNPSCEEVSVKCQHIDKFGNYIDDSFHSETDSYLYKITIPKEIDVLELGQIIPKEEPKQERIFDYNKKLESDCDDENFASGKIILQWNKEDQKQDTPLRICRMNLDLQYGNTAILRLEEIEELIKNLQIVRDRLL